ncbi:MAG: DUF3391 domain-containing protein [Marinagarivorans sp.]|nr:DUF3391 domain-containing protein [Marinagarivorans sp.]
MEHPFFKTKFLLKDSLDLESLIKSGIKEVWINTDKGLDADEIAAGKSLSDIEDETEKMLREAARAKRIEKTSMDEEVKTARRVCNKSKEAVITMFNDARLGKAIEVEQAQELVEEISNSVITPTACTN